MTGAATSPGQSEYETWADGADGLRVVDPMLDGAAAIARGDWVESGLAVAQGGVDLAAFALDPVGELSGMAAEWALEHCRPFQDLLDELLGDDEAVAAAAASWRGVGSSLAGVGEAYGEHVRADLAGQHGLALTAYRAAAAGAGTSLRQLAKAAGHVADGIVLAGSVLASVRAFVQATLADVVGKVAAAFARTAATGGLLAPEAGTRLALQVGRLLKSCRDLVVDLRTSLATLGRLVREVTGALEGTARRCRTLLEPRPGLLAAEQALELGRQHHALDGASRA